MHKKGIRDKGKILSRKKPKKIQISNQGKLRIAVALLLIIIAIFFISLLKWAAGWFVSYDGLGESKMQNSNPYTQTAFYYDEKGRLQYEDEKWTSLTGIDVSSYQQEVDWEKVAADGVDFAMVRLGYRGYSSGLLNLDTCYEQNMRNAHSAGLRCGVYFFSQAVTTEEAVEEAQFVVKHLLGKAVDGPVAFDMEYIEGADRINSLTAEEKTQIADAFCQFVENHGYEAIIYGNPTWLTEDVELEYLTQHDIWVAHYTDLTQWPFEYAMWQYTDSGTVDGIQGGCDLNIWMEEKSFEKRKEE